MKLYRFDDYRTVNGNPSAQLRTFNVERETESSYLIREEFEFFTNEFTKWVRKNARRRFAAPTEQEALQDYVKRKRRQAKILHHRLLDADARLNKAAHDLESDYGIKESTKYESSRLPLDLNSSAFF